MKFVAPPPITRPPEKPLQVYLDSSDYSNLSKITNTPGEKNAEIFNALLALVEDRKIEIRFSIIHLLEAAHLKSEYLDAGVRRARCIATLSKGRCFRPWTDVARFECSNVLNGEPVYVGVTMDDSRWYPREIDLFNPLKGLMKEGIEEIVSKGRSRRERRMLSKRFFPGGRFSGEALGFLKQNRAQLLEGLRKQVPLGDRFFSEDLMYKLAANQVSADDVADEFTIVFRDPEKFIGWLYETRDTEKKLIAWFRPHGRELVEKIASLRPTFASIKEHINDPAFRNEMDRFLRSKTLEIRNNWIIQMFENDPDLRSKAPDEKALTDLPLGALPSLDTSVAVLGEHIGNQRWVKS